MLGAGDMGVSSRYFHVPPWKAFVSVVITVLLALAALTRNPDWAMAIRFLTGGWLIAVPFVLKFDDVAPALWSYLVIGTLVAAAASLAALAALAAESLPQRDRNRSNGFSSATTGFGTRACFTTLTLPSAGFGAMTRPPLEPEPRPWNIPAISSF
jgi:hypothetical protein